MYRSTTYCNNTINYSIDYTILLSMINVYININPLIV